MEEPPVSTDELVAQGDRALARSHRLIARLDALLQRSHDILAGEDVGEHPQDVIDLREPDTRR